VGGKAAFFVEALTSEKIFSPRNSGIAIPAKMSCVKQNVNRLRLAILLIVTAVLVLKTSAAEAASMGKPLVELESHINWSAVDNAWKNIRPRWVATTGSCDDAECVAKQLLELEAHLKWKAVDAAWRTKRNGWVNDCKTATTDVEVAKLLLEFEHNVRWQAVDAGWKALRDGWIARVEG
jgi:hypothetical protein